MSKGINHLQQVRKVCIDMSVTVLYMRFPSR